MKVWNAIVTICLVVIIIILGIGYFNLSNAYNGLIEKSNALKKKNDILMEKQNYADKINKENNTLEHVDKNEESDLFYELVKNNSHVYELYDYSKDLDDNFKRYIGLLGGIYNEIPVFTSSNKLNNEDLSKMITGYIVSSNNESKLSFNADILVHQDIVNDFFKCIFGNSFDTSVINIEEMLPQKFEGYNDIYKVSSYFEFSELDYSAIEITDVKKIDNKYEVTFVEYSVGDDAFILEEGEKSKRVIYNNKSEAIKEYDIIGVTGEEYLEIEILDNGKKVTEEDIEKYVIENKDKFEMKKIIFEKDGSNMIIKSCESVK